MKYTFMILMFVGVLIGSASCEQPPDNLKNSIIENIESDFNDKDIKLIFYNNGVNDGRSFSFDIKSGIATLYNVALVFANSDIDTAFMETIKVKLDSHTPEIVFKQGNSRKGSKNDPEADFIFAKTLENTVFKLNNIELPFESNRITYYPILSNYLNIKAEKRYSGGELYIDLNNIEVRRQKITIATACSHKYNYNFKLKKYCESEDTDLEGKGLIEDCYPSTIKARLTAVISGKSIEIKDGVDIRDNLLSADLYVHDSISYRIDLSDENFKIRDSDALLSSNRLRKYYKTDTIEIYITPINVEFKTEFNAHGYPGVNYTAFLPKSISINDSPQSLMADHISIQKRRFPINIELEESDKKDWILENTKYGYNDITSRGLEISINRKLERQTYDLKFEGANPDAPINYSYIDFNGKRNSKTCNPGNDIQFEVDWPNMPLQGEVLRASLYKPIGYNLTSIDSVEIGPTNYDSLVLLMNPEFKKNYIKISKLPTYEIIYLEMSEITHNRSEYKERLRDIIEEVKSVNGDYLVYLSDGSNGVIATDMTGVNNILNIIGRRSNINPPIGEYEQNEISTTLSESEFKILQKHRKIIVHCVLSSGGPTLETVRKYIVQPIYSKYNRDGKGIEVLIYGIDDDGRCEDYYRFLDI